MSTSITGVVTNGIVIPNSPLPEGALVEIRISPTRPSGGSEAAPRPTLAELRRMPRAKRQDILAAAAALAEEDYRSDRQLTAFEAFSEEDRDDDESDSR